ncbi:MAG: PilZ domain-containing protein [Deltaproteobacteria bacterium]|nr:PilZ domain-containing protein [Deltaproteobacteria bacterium]
MQPHPDNEKRRHPRFQVQSTVFALVKSGAYTLGEVLDVSEGGLALTYVADSGPAVKEGALHLFGSGAISYLRDVPVRTVSDIELPNEVEFSTIPVRRMGVEFGELTETQQQKLRGFISQNALN